MKLLWQQISSPIITDILLSNTEYDGVVLDAEHGHFNDEQLYSCIQSRRNGKLIFVRLPEVNKSKISYCLDAGVDGLIFSTVETENQAKDIVKYCKYPPIGKRGLGFAKHNNWGEDKDLGLNKKVILIPQIETSLGVLNIKQILNEHFDYYLIGPYDLSLSLGSPGDYSSYNFNQSSSTLVKVIGEEKIGIHIPNPKESDFQPFINYGLKCIGMDTCTLVDYAKKLHSTL